MTSSEPSPDQLHPKNFSIKPSEASCVESKPSHPPTDDDTSESSNESLQREKTGSIPFPDACNSPSDILKGDVLLQAAQTLLEDDPQEPQELFPTVLGPQIPQELLLNNLESRKQYLLHDLHPPHRDDYQTDPPKQLQEDFGRTVGSKDGLRASFTLPVIEGFLAPLQQGLASVGELSSESIPMTPSHLSPLTGYTDVTYTPEVTTTATTTATTSKMTLRFKEKKKSKWCFSVIRMTIENNKCWKGEGG